MNNNQLRLLIMNYEYPPLGGGGGVGCEKIAQGLVSQYGYQVTVLTSGVGELIEHLTDEVGIKIIRVPCARKRSFRSSASFGFMLNYIIRSTLYIWKNRRSLQFDCVHTYFAIPTGPAGIAVAYILKIPHVLTLIGGELFKQPLELDGYNSKLINKVVKYITEHSDMVTAISHDTQQAAKKFLNITKEIKVISLGFIPPNFDCEPFRRHNQVTNNAIVQLVTVSRLVERKGFSYLLEALSKIDSSRWKLKFIGDGPEQTKLEKLVVNYNLIENVEFVGFVNEEKKYQLLSVSDIFVLPSLHEGLGLVYFEAMYCGLPIVTTDNGGQTDFLIPEENALLVSIANVEDLRKALLRAINDNNWRIYAGKNNQEKIKLLYLEKILPTYHTLFKKTTPNYPGYATNQQI